MPTKPWRAACIQLCASDDVDENISHIGEILQKNTKLGLNMVLLPENALLLSNNKQKKHLAAQKEAYSTFYTAWGNLAKKHHIWLVAGSMLIQDEQHPHKYLNHCPVFSPHGKLVCSYNKMHLFDADLGSESWQESQHISAGEQPQSLELEAPWKLGLSICYDLRFPELYRAYSQQGCNIMTVPAAFTVPTGQAHWEVLLRARAIENQCYILAAGQCGKHQDGRTTYGHSMIIDPWGNILSQQETGTGLIYADLSHTALQAWQQRMPVLQHRRLP